MLEKHDVFAEFPEHRERIEAMMRENDSFRSLVDEYGQLDREVYGLESAGTPVSDQAIEDMKKRRLNLKDRIFAAL